MAKTHPHDDPTQLTMYTAMQYVPQGDGSYKVVPQKPVCSASISQAAKITGLPRDTIYRLYRAGFIAGDRPGPRSIRIDMASLFRHRLESAEEDWWTPERRRIYQHICGK